MLEEPVNVMHLEFVSSPIKVREFLLLLEKVILVEQYHVMMKYISKESEDRIEAYEGLMDINRKEIFDSLKEKKSFEKILRYEKNLQKEQTRLTNAIHDFTMVRKSDFFDMKKRIDAEENLSKLRFNEIDNAKTTIVAQESIIDFSAEELSNAQKILNAKEYVAEMGRNEAMELHEQLAQQKTINESLSEEIENLLLQVETLKKG